MAMKYSKFRKGHIVFAALAEALIALVAVTSLLFTEVHPTMLINVVSDAFTSPKVKSIYPSIQPSINPSTTLRIIEGKSSISTHPVIEECHTIHKQLNSCNTLPNFYLHEAARSEYENSIINFWHVEKAGGSTIERCFMNVYKERNLPETFRGTSTCENFMDILSNEQYFKDDAYRPVIRGHSTLVLCDFLHEQVTGRKCSLFSMFREPYERVVSYYFFCRQTARRLQNPNDFYSKSLRLPILDWVKKFGSVVQRAFVQNWQISENADGSKECSMIHDSELNRRLNEDDEFVEDVLNNLDKYLSVVGLYEELSTTMGMLQRVYNIPFYDNCSAIHEIEGAYEGLSGAARDELQSRAKQELMDSEEIKEILKFDLKLYAKAKELFEAQKLEFFAWKQTTNLTEVSVKGSSNESRK